LNRPESRGSVDNRTLTVSVRTSFEQSDQTYGSPRVWRDLRAWGFACSVKLERQFEATAPNQRWVADFTYIWAQEGWLYFAVVLDLFSRRVVGWSMNQEMTAQLVTDALVMAIWCLGRPTQLLHHSDQGSTRVSSSRGY
jgi:putative transposase